MRATPSAASGILIGLVSALAFGASGPFVKTLLEAGWSPASAVFLRTLGATIVLAPLGVWALRGRFAILRREWRLVVGFGLVAVAGAQLCYFAAVSRMPVGISLLIEYLAPVLLVLAAWGRTRRAPRSRTIAGSALSIGGLVLVIDIAGATPDLLGVLFALGAAVCLGGYFVLSARPTDLPPVALAAGGLLVASLALGSALLVGVLPASAPLVDVELLGSVVPWWVPLGVIVLVATAFAYVAGIVAAGRMGERLASFVGLSEVLFAVLIAWLLLGEVPSVVQAMGGALIVAGVILVRLDGAKRPTPTALDLPAPTAVPTP
ncbi:threonine/homoserine efflux transporter RhtA [Labedella gwakjiensis]|uniref:DMT family transporter n=1 Tax=Labedella gwakjiensis TaxID=390269 RepID=A0A2P8GSG3_9MICO|nr:DMT family transporter [Labedella gwakjiensis]PSL36906.1 threonine/homoserine efflux transporter RhtA [Labedella gwakjiensis]RUQ84398.1 DMT family transporter [Labedella gwakjiensis]